MRMPAAPKCLTVTRTPLRLLTLALVAGIGAGCTLVGTAPPPPPAPGVAAAPAIAEGESTELRDRAAAQSLAEGEARLAAGDAEGARLLAREVASRYPEARGSSAAYWLEARAEEARGELEAAERAAGRFVDLVGTGTPEGSQAQLLRVRVLARAGGEGAVEALFRLPETVPTASREEALGLARQLASGFDDASLRDLLQEAPTHGWILPVFLVELGERRVLVGDVAVGRTLGERALSMNPGSAERERAERILSGEIIRTGTRVAGVLVAVLSETGSPGLQQLSREIRHGIEVALLDDDVRGGVRLEVADDGGQPARSGEALRTAQGRSPFGVVGPLTEPGLAEAARNRTDGLPMVSPTSRIVPEGLQGVYTIAGADPEALRVLADLVWRDGNRQVAVFHRRSPEEELELRWFREAFEERGGQVLRTWSYAPGTTTFNEPLQAIARLRPRALLILVPPEDVELVAPQLAFYGVDDVEDLQLYGGAAWTAEGVLSSVPVRHTDGVRTVTSHLGPGYGPAWPRFVAAYEAHFQRTLRSPVPGLGWDAARLLLAAAEQGGPSPAGVARGLTLLRDVPGATGTFSFRNGRISRSFTPVEIQNRTLVPLDDLR